MVAVVDDVPNNGGVEHKSWNGWKEDEPIQMFDRSPCRAGNHSEVAPQKKAKVDRTHVLCVADIPQLTDEPRHVHAELYKEE